ncbi:MAG TPA: DUF5668 domain-containing protein [Ferruginibacter sp.]|nr:DUF5668 domain-containing protein [Ferruginibacter sp.]HPH92847.1 DUF5668 domain-containing protein [Ferruginibacter sp.]
MSNGNENSNNNSRVFAGLFIIAIGLLFFMRQSGWAIFPHWLFSWPMILIAVGIFVGVRSDFRGSGWLVMLIIGSIFLMDDILEKFSLKRYLVPAILVGVGFMMILRPKRSNKWKDILPVKNAVDTEPLQEPVRDFHSADSSVNPGIPGDNGERLDATAVFGAVKRNVVSKNFRGGEATSVFGGSEIDLSQADIHGTVKLEVTAILGGVKLIVPAHWMVKQEMTAVFGGVDDKRDNYQVVPAPNKILVLEGIAFMGGIEISSYR